MPNCELAPWLCADPVLSGADVAALVAGEYGVTLHRRTVERARRR